MSDIYRKAALKHKLVTLENAGDVRALAKPGTVKEVLLALARDALPQRMPTDYVDIVVACLTCLEGGFGREGDFLEDAASRLKLLVVEGLARMY